MRQADAVQNPLAASLHLSAVNAALLAFTDDDVHGVASAFVVVSRMVGMLVGISALTTIGLSRYFAALRPKHELEAALVQIQAIFVGAAVCAVVAGVLSLVLFRGAATSSVTPADTLASRG